MNLNHIILTTILLTPLVGAGVLALIPERPESKTHHIAALIFTLLTLLFTLHLPTYFNYSLPVFHFEKNKTWIA